MRGHNVFLITYEQTCDRSESERKKELHGGCVHCVHCARSAGYCRYKITTLVILGRRVKYEVTSPFRVIGFVIARARQTPP